VAAVTGTVQHLVRESKDAALAVAARAFLHRRLDGVAEVESLTIDTATQSLRMRVGLAGEADPVVFDVRRYLLHASDHSASITLLDASASRPWIDRGLQAFVLGRPFIIPTKVAFALRLLA
jgi:hypothetical protein